MANAQLNIYDYTTVDPYWGFEEQFVIGYGDLTAEAINEQIDEADGDLDVHINSQGGKVFDGWAIYNKLKAYDKGVVTVYIDGIAASIASIIAMAGERVVMMQASMMMIHKPTGFYIGAMDASELASEAQSLTEIESVLIDVYATKTGLSDNKLQTLLDATTWLSPDSALALGFCDIIEKNTKQPTIPQNVFDRLFENAGESTRVYANNAFSIKQNKNTEFKKGDSVEITADHMDGMKGMTGKISTVENGNYYSIELDEPMKGVKNPHKWLAENEIKKPKKEMSNDMSTVKELTEKQEQQGNMLTDIWNYLKGDKKNEGDVPAEVHAEVPAPVDGEPTLEELKEENAQLKAAATADKEKVDNAQSILDKANELYTKMENTLAEVKSNYKAPEKGQEFDKSTPTNNAGSNFVKPTKTK